MNEREEHSGVDLADADSLLGMLQRGRGKGFLVALETPPQEVWPLLFQCITNDPRLDTQCEDRAEYYAALIAATRMDVEPFGPYLKRNDALCSTCDCCAGLILDTLGCLRENAIALQILREYVSYGRRWTSVLGILADRNEHEALERAATALCHRLKMDTDVRTQFEQEVREHWKWYCYHDEDTRARCVFFLPMCEPWKTICEKNGDLTGYFADFGIAYDQPSSPRKPPSEEYLASLSLEDLFRQVSESNCTCFWRVLPEKVSPDHEDYLLQRFSSGDKHHMRLALRGLGELGTAKVFEEVKSYIETSENADPKVRRSAFDAIERMPGALSLETARRWFRRREWHLQVAAGSILENHAMPEDIPLLLEALRTPETIRGEDFRLSNALDAMARFEGIGPVPELEHIFCEAQSCFDRYRAANAMAATSPVHFTAGYALECLWDCHWDTRKLGCETVNLSADGAIERLRELATNSNESEHVRDQAQTRLEAF